MKVAVLGGGFAGLSAAYYLTKKGHKVTLFEKEPVLGGLAVGFKQPSWKWFMEKAVHHHFTNDIDIHNFGRDMGFTDFVFRTPLTASFYRDPVTNNSRIIPVDSPQDFLRFPYLSMPVKIRAAFVLAFFKLTPFLKLFERYTAEEFMRKTMGNRAWEVLFAELFRKKFGKYAGNIVASFIWARITKRTRKLGYVKGGFQKLLDHTEKTLQDLGVKLNKQTTVEEIKKKNGEFVILGSKATPESGQARLTFRETFDAVVSTLPTPILTRLATKLFSQNYLKKLSGIKYMHAISLIVESKQPFLKKAYWINMVDQTNPIMGIFQHTNFMDKKYYGGNHLTYIGNYIDFENPLVRMSDKEVFNHYKKYLKKINPQFKFVGIKYFVFKGPFAQPVFDKDFLKRKPDFKTPVKNFFIANLDMTYPYDRGTNYAVKLGREVSNFF